MYDVNSKHADDFINHEEIMETLAYADENKDNLPLIESLIEKPQNAKGFPTERRPYSLPVRIRR